MFAFFWLNMWYEENELKPTCEVGLRCVDMCYEYVLVKKYESSERKKLLRNTSKYQDPEWGYLKSPPVERIPDHFNHAERAVSLLSFEAFASDWNNSWITTSHWYLK